MKWRVLATDFDGTLAVEGVVQPVARDAVQRARAAGLVILLVTGRELRDFEFLDVDLRWFDLVVAENGAVLYDPVAAAETLLAPAPSLELVEELRRLEVAPLSVGMTIVATTEPYEVAVLETIKNLGLELVITFNKGSVMILPPGINKASGMLAALERLGISANLVVAVGDAENDHAFLQQAGLAVAVANALPALKDHAHLTTQGGASEGVAELIDKILSGELDEMPMQ